MCKTPKCPQSRRKDSTSHQRPHRYMAVVTETGQGNLGPGTGVKQAGCGPVRGEIVSSEDDSEAEKIVSLE